MMNTQSIIHLHNTKTAQWKSDGVVLDQTDLSALIEQNHAFNFQLWHAEDRARRDDMGFEYVYRAKREIDHFNQQRNNCMESIDQYFWKALNPAATTTCPVHSETPGMMIDRLSILALKAYHMHLQTVRDEVDAMHRQQCQQKLDVILAQQAQLGECLAQLLEEVKAGERTFRVYHQFKMYNDPKLNPELYCAQSQSGVF